MTSVEDQDFEPSGFFVLRTPLDPFDTLLAWSDGLGATTAWQATATADGVKAAIVTDQRVLRDRMRALLARPEVREAVFIASPSLLDSLAQWERDPESESGQKVERSLTRYFARMAGRATPFGLFAGCSVGLLGAETRLELPPRASYGRHTRLDMDYVSALADALARNPETRRTLPHHPNSSLYAVAAQWRYAEARLRDKARSYHLVAVDRTDYLDEILRYAAAGVRPSDLAAELARVADVDVEEAASFVDELCANQMLVPALEPQLTGPEPVDGMVDLLQTSEAGRDSADTLVAAQRAIAALDAAGLGHPIESYLAIARELEALPTPVELPRLFQVDMVKPTQFASLGTQVVDELAQGIAVLRQIASPPEPADKTSLGRFKTAFRERYEEREVALVEVLDEDGGIGFDRPSDAGAEDSPLLEGLGFGADGGGAGVMVSWGNRERRLLARLLELARRGDTELVLDNKDLIALESSSTKLPLPDAFSVRVTLSAASPEALARGEFQLLVRGGSGPSGANLLGRFCHGDPALEEHVRAHIQAEEALRPDAVFAEVVHLPEGRVGNVLARPTLRGWEIPFLGRSGAPRERQIDVGDLVVSVRGDRVILRSRRLDREVLPRLTTAHNFGNPQNLGVYRFLCALSYQGTSGLPAWDWGPLESLAYLPRVRHGRLVLARARWGLTKDQLAPVTKAATSAERFVAAQRLREELAWPRFLELADGDNELTIDLDNVLSIDTFAQLVKQRTSVLLVEMWPHPDELCVHGPEGRFSHELVVPYTRRRPGPSPATSRSAPVLAAVSPASSVDAELPRRCFPPGSEWLYAKIYTGTGFCDRVLREAVAPTVSRALATGAAESWFFLRYGDPAWHLRVRFRGDPTRLRTEVEPALHEALCPLFESSGVFRLVFDTYEREVERYGGAAGVAWSERLFQADSDAALALLDELSADGAADARWRLTLRGMDQLLDDLGYDDAGRLAIVTHARVSFGDELGVDTSVEKVLGDKFRKQRILLEALLDPAQDDAGLFAELLPALHRRSQVIREVASGLRAAPLSTPLDTLAISFLHMHANRMLRAAARPQELVLYDFLKRLYEGRLARARPARRAAKPKSRAAQR